TFPHRGAERHLLDPVQDLCLGHLMSIRAWRPQPHRQGSRFDLVPRISVKPPGQSGGGGMVYPISLPAVIAASQNTTEKIAAILAFAVPSPWAATVPSGAGRPAP